MIDRRAFSTLLAATIAGSRRAFSQTVNAKTVFYASVGPELTLHDVDIETATLARRSSVRLPADVQYAWPHPSRRFFYVVSSNGTPGTDGAAGSTHMANAFRIDPMSGALSPHGDAQRLPSRPIHTSVDGKGQYLLIAYNNPSNVTVHRINADGTIGALVNQPIKPDTGIYGHQIRTTATNATAILVTRGNNAMGSRPEDPGALKIFSFKDGVLTNMQSVTAGNNGLGFGPRHLDFHPTKPWVFVSIERQNQLYVYQQNASGALLGKPLFVKGSLADTKNVHDGQGAGPIHVSPDGRFVYQTNRNAGTTKYQGKDVFAGGENNIAVWAIDQTTGEPQLIQTIDGHGIQLRTFGIHPSGRLLVAASIQPLLVRDGDKLTTLAAGLSVYRVGADGKLAFARKYDVDVGNATQFWSGMVTLA
jgi:6-phosphogluconolactonase (cycloisomerase 2 family)